MADRIFAIAVLLFAAAFFAESRSFAAKNATQTLSSAFFPTLIITVMSAFAILVFIRSFKRPTPGISFTGLAARLKEHWRIPVLFAMFAGYVALMPAAGFRISTILFLLAGFIVLQPRFQTKRLLLYVPLSLALAYGIFFIFERQLHILLP